MQIKSMCLFVLFFSFLVVLQRGFFAEAARLKNHVCLKNGDHNSGKDTVKNIRGGFVKNGVVKNGFIKYGFMKTAGPRGLLRIGGNNCVSTFYKSQRERVGTKHIVKVRKMKGMFLQNSQKEFGDHTSSSLNENRPCCKFIEKWKSKFSSNRFRIIIKNIFLGSICIISFSFLYNFLLNKKMEFIVQNVFKDKLFCITSFQRGDRTLCFLSYSEFKSSPFFLSTIVIASYTFYIFVKVYIEKYKEAKRIKTAIQEYNKKKEQYINTGVDEDENQDDNTEEGETETDRDRKIKKQKEGMLDVDSSEENITNDLYSLDAFYENDELDNEQNMF